MDDVDTMMQRSHVVVYQMYVLGNLTLAGWLIRNYMMLLTVLLLVLRSSVLSLLLYLGPINLIMSPTYSLTHVCAHHQMG